MTPFDISDPERWQPSMQTPRCALCEEAALPQYGGFCFRHMGATGHFEQPRRVVAARRI
jgi:hypothetical protein